MTSLWEKHSLIIKDIADAIISNASENWVQDGRPSIADMRITRHTYSQTIQLEIHMGNKKKRVYVKIPITDEHNKQFVIQRLSTEYDILKDLYKAFLPYDNISVVKPVAFLAEHNAIVTEEAPGNTLQDLIGTRAKIFTISRDAVQLEHYCYLCGQWLAIFHSITKKGQEPFRIESVLRYCDYRLGLLARTPNSGIDDLFRGRILDCLNVLAQRIPPESNIIAGRHNDYAPHNVIVNDGKISVLDFNMYDQESIYYDICNFWHKLESMKISPLYSSDKIAQLQNQFFEGYGQSVDLKFPGFIIAQYRFTVTKMATMAGSQIRMPHRWLVNKYLYLVYLNWLKKTIKEEVG